MYRPSPTGFDSRRPSSPSPGTSARRARADPPDVDRAVAGVHLSTRPRNVFTARSPADRPDDRGMAGPHAGTAVRRPHLAVSGPSRLAARSSSCPPSVPILVTRDHPVPVLRSWKRVRTGNGGRKLAATKRVAPRSIHLPSKRSRESAGNSGPRPADFRTDPPPAVGPRCPCSPISIRRPVALQALITTERSQQISQLSARLLARDDRVARRLPR